MTPRRAALLCTLMLTPQLALAAPADSDPPVQRPSQGSEQNVATDTTPAPTEAEEAAKDTTSSPETQAETSPEAEAKTPTPSDDADQTEAKQAPDGAPAEPDASEGAAPTSPPPAASEPESKAEQEDLSHLLDSNEPEASPRVRVRPSSPDRVDRSERLRNYYASIYRPKHNPARVFFAARGAYALAGTSDNVGGGRMGYANVEVGQTWNFVGYGINAAVYAGGLTFGSTGVEQFAPVLVGGGPSIGLGRLSLLGRGYLDFRAGYNFFYAPVAATREGMANPPDAAPHGPKLQLDVGLLFHDSESRRFRHGIGFNIGWQLLVHSLAGDFPLMNTFNIGVGYFFG